MSRSRRKTKIRGNTTAVSEKQNKEKANRKYRRVVKQVLKKRKEVLPQLREVSNVWNFDKDGKSYNSEMLEKHIRK